jgi:energy-coupling factor transporter transmembrane protein EcfT
LALLTACFIDRWLSEPAGVSRWALRNAWISTILVGFGIVVAVPFVTAVFLPGEWWIGSVGLILVLGGVFCWRATLHDQRQRAAVAFAVMSALFLTAVFGFAALRVDRFQNARPMIAAIRMEEKGSELISPIATYRFFRESTVFYARHPVMVCDNNPATKRTAQEALAYFLAKSKSPSKRSYVITTDEYEREIAKAFPNQFTPIFSQRRFLGPGEMVVLRHEEGDGHYRNLP